MTVWAEIGGTSSFSVARFEDAWEIFLRYGDGRIGFIVFKEDVVARFVLFDERILE